MLVLILLLVARRRATCVSLMVISVVRKLVLVLSLVQVIFVVMVLTTKLVARWRVRQLSLMIGGLFLG